ncbi:sigma-70 family RNA polymerase sigma factor [Pontibacter sp. JAM-7]|uniref:sigma-70 family RNA polymerase sigma factor n=1 Tax=Pontibacter sp. JAM-7 TaxID=3366581 RepID=UPI003AF9CB7B
MKKTPPGDDVENLAFISNDATEGLDSLSWTQMLAELARSKDRRLYIQLFRHFAPRVKAYIRRLGVLESVADELMQETMLSVWRKAHMFNPDKAAASTWIFTLARNQSIDWMRKQKYPTCSYDDVIPDIEQHETHDTPCIEQGLVTDRVRSAINNLPENQAQVLYMSFFEGRSHAEISSRLDIPLGSVKSRIRLACDKLKQHWRGGEL